jgi:hypothetical protein
VGCAGDAGCRGGSINSRAGHTQGMRGGGNGQLNAMISQVTLAWTSREGELQEAQSGLAQRASARTLHRQPDAKPYWHV